MTWYNPWYDDFEPPDPSEYGGPDPAPDPTVAEDAGITVNDYVPFDCDLALQEWQERARLEW